MKHIVNICRKGQHNEILWAYTASAGSIVYQPAIADFQYQGLRLAILDKCGHISELNAYVHIETFQ